MTTPSPSPFHPATRAAGLHLLGEGAEELSVSIERQWENLLDWEHLPHLHPGNFRSVTLVDGGRWWWRARVGSANGGLVVCLVIDPDANEWGIEVEEGPTAGIFVHLRAEVLEERRMRVHGRFLSVAPPRNEATKRALYHYFKNQFGQLAVEDGAAMQSRQDSIDHLARGTTDELCTVDEARSRAPFVVRWRGTRYWIREEGGSFRASAADCPHLLGPLPCPGSGPTVCPWHAYRFDPETGKSCDGRGLRLRPAPALVVVDGRLAWA